MQAFLYLYVTDSLCQFFWRITFYITATAQSIAHPFSSALMNVSARQDSESAVKNRGRWRLFVFFRRKNKVMGIIESSFSSVCRVFPSKFLKRWKGCSNSPLQLIAAHGNIDLQHFALTVEITPIVRRAVVLSRERERFIAAPTSGIPLHNVHEWGKYRL